MVMMLTGGGDDADGRASPPASSSKRRSTPTLASAGTSPCPCCNAKEDAAAQATPLRGRESAPDAGGGTATGQRQRRAALPPPEDSASASSAASRAKVFQSTKKGTPSKAHSHSRQRQRRQRRWPKPPSPLTGTLAGAPPSSARSKNTCRAALSSALSVRQPGPSGYHHNATIDSATLLRANSPSSPAMARAPSLARRQATAPGAHGRRMI